MKQISNPQLELAYNFVQYTHRNIFLTGKAGTGKTTFLQQLKANSLKRMVVVAPTGVAAINAGGVTIHSFFQLPFGPNVPKVGNADNPFESDNREKKPFEVRMSREKINIMRSLDLLVIDEISMVRADLLDAIDETLRRYKRNSKPFGGVQLLMIGDIQQLPPVVKDEDWNLLKAHYPTLFFFGSLALKKTEYVSIELKHIYRQSNTHFIEILNKIRDNRLDQAALEELNKRYIPNFDPPQEEGYITLTTHNRQAQSLNESKLKALTTPQYHFEASIDGDFPEYSYPTEKDLLLKEGSQVMFVKNDSSQEKRYFNGKIGTIIQIDDEEIVVKCGDEPGTITVTPEKWDNMKYSLNETTQEIEEKVVGSFTQYPLKLAWAITIHKSQGLTFERAIIYADAAFAHGQIYVALSRCKTLEGLVLGAPIRKQGIINDGDVNSFNKLMAENEPDENGLNDAKQSFQLELLIELFDFQSVQKNLYHLQRQLKENAPALVDSPLMLLDETLKSVRSELIAVSEKFASQMTQLLQQHGDLEQNNVLQERISKAALYFGEKTNNLDQLVQNRLIAETDNKAVQKALHETLERIVNELQVKQICLKEVEKGFILKDFLNTRAKALIEESRGKNSFIRKTIKHENESNLASLLKSWRDDKADELGQISYQILPQKTIAELVKKMPVTLKQLKEIKGIGYLKINAFGKEILKIITNYQKANHIEPAQIDFSEDESLEDEKAKRTKEPNSKQLSFELFEAGKTIAEIAALRNLTKTTIEGHLALYVSTGELSLDRLIDQEKAAMIEAYFLNNDNRAFATARAALGESVSYSEIRYVLNRMTFEGKIQGE